VDKIVLVGRTILPTSFYKGDKTMWFLGSSKCAKIYAIIISILSFGYLVFLLVSCSQETKPQDTIKTDPGRKVVCVSEAHTSLNILTEEMGPEDKPRVLKYTSYGVKENHKKSWEIIIEETK
jgi:hypothetical protein